MNYDVSSVTSDAALPHMRSNQCWECREYVALSDVSLSVCDVVDYRFIG